MTTATQFPASKFQTSSFQVSPSIGFDTDVDADLDVDNGFFDAAGFAANALSDWRKLAARCPSFSSRRMVMRHFAIL